VALACGLPHIAAWAEGSSSSLTSASSGAGGGGGAAAGGAHRGATASDASAPGHPLLAGSSLPAKKRGKTGSSSGSSNPGVADTTSPSASFDPGAPTVQPTSQQYHEYLHWLQQQVLGVLDEVQHEAGVSRP
jgi:hypothetical protein